MTKIALAALGAAALALAGCNSIEATSGQAVGKGIGQIIERIDAGLTMGKSADDGFSLGLNVGVHFRSGALTGGEDRLGAHPVHADEGAPAAEALIDLPAASAGLDAEQAVVRAMVEDMAVARGIDPLDFLAVAWIESRLRPLARNPKSTASGVFQFIARTARAYDLDDPFDARANVEAASRLWRDNKAALAEGLDREPTGAELYLAHQQGASGALRLIRGGSMPAYAIVGRDAVALNGGTGSTTAEAFLMIWAQKFDAARARFDPA